MANPRMWNESFFDPFMVNRIIISDLLLEVEQKNSKMPHQWILIEIPLVESKYSMISLVVFFFSFTVRFWNL